MAPFNEPLVIVGNPDEVHVGRHLAAAARSLDIPITLCDSRQAFGGFLQRIDWRLRGHRPSHLRRFSASVLDVIAAQKARHLITTGIAPLDRTALRDLAGLGVSRINFLTDDPWNRAHRAPWFMDALQEYDRVFTARTANMAELTAHGCRHVGYLPFAYAPDIHFPDPPDSAEEWKQFGSDVVFVGGADEDRIAWIGPLIEAGLNVALYGGYWDKYPQTRASARGMATARVVRKAIGGAKTALCLVRQANRDGQSMRSFEVPAIGACMIVEDTEEHRAIFGRDNDAVLYASTPAEARRRILGVLDDRQNRERLAAAARNIVTGNGHTWSDRLTSMLAEH